MHVVHIDTYRLILVHIILNINYTPTPHFLNERNIMMLLLAWLGVWPKRGQSHGCVDEKLKGTEEVEAKKQRNLRFGV